MLYDDVCDDKSWHCDTENFTDYRNRVFHVFDYLKVAPLKIRNGSGHKTFAPKV